MINKKQWLAMTFSVTLASAALAAAPAIPASPSKITVIKTAPTTTNVAQHAASNKPIPLNRIVAIVNNNIITQTQLDQQITIVKAQIAESNTPLPPEAVLAKQVLNQLITRNLQLDLASRNNINVTGSDVDNAIAHIAKSQQMSADQFYQHFEENGVSKKALQQEIKDDIIVRNLQQAVMSSRITITPQEVDSFIQAAANTPNANHEEYNVGDILVALPATPSPQEVIAAQQKANKLVAELQNGANFQQMAIAQSGGQAALKGGTLGWRKISELPDAFAKMVMGLQTGQVSTSIRTPNGFHILKLLGTRDATAKKQATATQVNLQEMVIGTSTHLNPAQALALTQKLRAEIINGGDFATLAKQYSQTSLANTDSDGSANWVNISTLPAPVVDAIKNLSTGDISPIFRYNHHYYFVKLTAKRTANQVSSDERKEAEQALFQRKSIEELQNWLAQLRGQAYVKILPPYNS